MSHLEKEHISIKILGAGCYVDSIGDLSDLFDHFRHAGKKEVENGSLHVQERARKALVSALPLDSDLSMPTLLIATGDDIAESVKEEATILGLKLTNKSICTDVISALSNAKSSLESTDYSRVLLAFAGSYHNLPFLAVLLLSSDEGYLGELLYTGIISDTKAHAKRPGLVILEEGLEENLEQMLPADGLFSGVSIFAPDSDESLAIELLKLILCLTTKSMLAGRSSRLKSSNLYCLETERPWLEPTAMIGSKRRRGALVTSRGQIILEESPQDEWNTINPFQIPVNQETEIFLLKGESRADLESKLSELVAIVESTSEADLNFRDLAYSVNSTEPTSDKHRYRAAIVASNRIDLEEKAESLRESLLENKPTRKDIYYAGPDERIDGQIAFMLPGLGAAYQGMLADLRISYPIVNLIMANLEYLSWRMDGDRDKLPSKIIYPFENQDNFSTAASNTSLLTADFAVAAILHAEYALDAVLKDLNIEPDAYLGMSTGEYANYFLNGYIRVEYVMIEFYRFIVELARSIPENKFSALKTVNIFGTLASVKDLIAAVPELSQELHIVGELAMEHVMVTGTKNAVAILTRMTESRGIASLMMPAAIPYHTPLVEDLLNRDQTEIFKSSKTFSRVEVPSWSCALEGPAPEDKSAIEDLAANLFRMPIKLYQTALQMYDSGIRQFVEIGPGSILTTKITEILKDRPVLALASNVQGKSGVTQLNHLIASLFIHGRDPDLKKSYLRRGCRLAKLSSPKEIHFEPKPIEEFYLKTLAEVKSAVDRASAEVFERYNLHSGSDSGSGSDTTILDIPGICEGAPDCPCRIAAAWVDEADFDLEEQAIKRCLSSHFTSKEQAFFKTFFGDDGRRLSWFLGRLAAKKALVVALKEALGKTIPPGNIEIENDDSGVPWGKVQLEEDSDSIRIPISISHSSGNSRVACCLAVIAKENQNYAIGVDVEELRTMESGIEELVLSDRERRLFAGTDKESRDKLFLKLWTAKESAYKALGGKSIKAYETIELDEDRGRITLLHKDKTITVTSGVRRGHVYSYTLLKN